MTPIWAVAPGIQVLMPPESFSVFTRYAGALDLELPEEVHRAGAQELVADQQVDVEPAAQQRVARDPAADVQRPDDVELRDLEGGAAAEVEGVDPGRVGVVKEVQAQQAALRVVDVAAEIVAADAGVLGAEVQTAEGVEAPGAQLAAVADLDAERGDDAPLRREGRRRPLRGRQVREARGRAHAEQQVAGAVDRAQVLLAVGAQHVLARDGVADRLVAEQRVHQPLRELGELVQLRVIDLLLAFGSRVAAEHRPAALELVELDDQALLAALVDGGEARLVRHLVLEHAAQVQRRIDLVRVGGRPHLPRRGRRGWRRRRSAPGAGRLPCVCGVGPP